MKRRYKYKPAAERPVSMSVSLTENQIGEYDEVASQFIANRSKFMTALVKYIRKHKNEKEFKREIETLLDEK